MDLKAVVNSLKNYAKLNLASSWDNVGLLVEPPSLKNVSRMLLTNDLTEAVMDEATEKKVDFILSYHPPIFKPLKRITSSHWKERIIGRCLEQRIAVYSPHTCFDAMAGGVNDWLIEAFGTGVVTPIQVVYESSKWSLSVSFQVDNSSITDQVTKTMESSSNNLLITNSGFCVTVLCTNGDLSMILSVLENSIGIKEKSIAIYSLLNKVPKKGHGDGRKCRLRDEITISEAVQMVKDHLQLPFIRLALKHNGTLASKVSTVAVCAGAGVSVLNGVTADLVLTGEMSHHEVLELTHSGSSVILTDHSNSERGFLKVLQPKLHQMLEKVDVVVSEVDADPLEIV